MNIKRIICLTVIICLLGQVLCFSYYQDTVSTDYQKPVDVLASLGILKGYDDGTFKPEGDITRAEFVCSVTKFLGISDVKSENLTYYNDVPDGYWALSEINTATALGLISGYPNRTFNPEEKITVSESIKVIVAALGYDYIAKSKGGYPSGYLSVAYENRILSGVKTEISSKAKRGDIAKILYNSLEVKMAVETSKGIEISDKTVLGNNLGIQKKKGQITATKFGEITPIHRLAKDEIAVDSVIYKISDAFIHELIGYSISFYVKENNDDLQILYYQVENNKNYPILVWAENIERSNSEFSVNNFVYTNDEGNIKEEKISTGFMIKNGERVAISSPDDIAPNDGNVLLIDSDGDSLYETIFVNEAKNIVVERINNTEKDVYSKYQARYKINLETDNQKEVNLIKDENEVEFSSLKEWDVLTVYESPSGNKITAYISDITLEGKVDEITEDNDIETLIIDGVAYKVAYSFKEAIKSGLGNVVTPFVGMRGRFHLDVNGKISAIEKTTGNEEKYALLTAAMHKGFKFQLKVLPEDGPMAVLDAASKLAIDDGHERRIYKFEDIIPKLMLTRVPEPGETTQNSLYQIIRYTTNSDGEVNKIIVAKLPQDNNSPIRDKNIFARSFMSSTIVTNGVDIVNGAYKIPKATAKIFVIPTDRRDDTKYKKETIFVKATNYTMALYDMDQHNFVNAAMIYQPKPGDYGVDPKYNAYFIVDKVTIANNEEGEQVYRIYGIFDKQSKYYDFDNDPRVNQGDVYQIGLLDGKVAKMQQIYKASTDSYAKSSPLPSGLGETGKATDQVYLAYLEVKDVTSKTIVLSNGTKECLLNLSTSARYTLYDRNAKKVTRASLQDVNVGDRVVVRTFDLTAGDLVIIR